MTAYQSNRAEQILNCDEELEIEQAREEIASMESEHTEPNVYNGRPPKVFNYSKNKVQPTENLKRQSQYYNYLDNDAVMGSNSLNAFYGHNKPSNVHYLSNNESQSNEDDGEPVVEYVNNLQSILNQYNPYTRTFFKCSIYSPSNRLYTVDEVNSTVSDPEMSSHFRFSNKNQDSINMTNSMITPMTPTPKVSKVMHTRQIRTKTDKQEQGKLNMSLLGPFKRPTSAKFLFKTVSSLPSNKSRDLGSPVIPLNSVQARNSDFYTFNQSELKSKKNLNNDSGFVTKKISENKVIKLSAEKKPLKLSARKKAGATRNISTGDIKQIYHDGSSGGSFVTNEDIRVAAVPVTEIKKVKEAVPPKKAQISGVNKVKPSIGRLSRNPKMALDYSPIQAMPSTPVKKHVPPESIKKREVADKNVGRYSLAPNSKLKEPLMSNMSMELQAPANRAAMRSYEKQSKTQDIEALIDVDRRTIVFEKVNSDMVLESSDIDFSHPLHQITWYQQTSLEDIESAIDEVVEIMEELKQRREIFAHSE